MQARIFKPSKTAMQSGCSSSDEWRLEFTRTNNKKIDPIMGWTASSDMMQEIKLKFPSKDSAIEFAKSSGYCYEVREPQIKKFVKQSYADNFK